MKHYLNVLLLKNYQCLEIELTYRIEMVFLLATTTVSLVSSLIVFYFIFSQVNVVGDWGYIPTLYLFALGNIAISVFTMFSWGPIYHQYRPAIKSGSLDLFLLKPISPIFLISTGRFDASGAARLIPAIFLLVYLMIKYPFSTNFLTVIFFIVLALAGTALLHGMIFLFYTFGFWTISTDSFHHLAWTFISQTAKPITIFPKPVFLVLSTIIPVAFAAVFPTRVLTGLEKDYFPLLLSTFLVLAFFFVMIILLWRAGLRRYSGVSA